MTVIKLVQGDTRPQTTLSLTDEDSGLPIDVSAAGTVVTMKFRAQGTKIVLQTFTAAKLTGQVLPDGTIDYTVTVPGLGGRVAFGWPPNALAVDIGYYEGEVAINFADGTEQTIYSLIKFYVRPEF